MRASVATGLERLALLVACFALAWGPLAQGSTFGVWFSGLIILGSVTLALTFLAIGVRGRLTLPNPWWLLFAALFLAWVWRSALTAPDVLAGERWAGIWTAVLGVAFSLAALAGTYRRQQVVLSTLLVTGGAAVTLALLQQRGVFVPGFTYLDGVPEKILTGPYFHPSHFSGYLIMVAALCTTVLLNTRPGWHTLPILALAAGAQYTNLFTDGSSIPAVMLAAGVPVIVWAWKHRPWAGVTLSATALAAAAWVVITLTTPAGQAQFDTYSKQIGINQSFETFIEVRKAIHRFGSALIDAQPITGVGPGQWATEFQTVRAPVTDHPFRRYADGQYVNYAHSDYLMVAVELGLIGAALLSVTLLVSLIGRGLSVLALTGTALVPVYLFTGLYESHLSAIPGTMIGAYVLILGARVLQPKPRTRSAVPAAPAVDLSL